MADFPHNFGQALIGECSTKKAVFAGAVRGLAEQLSMSYAQVLSQQPQRLIEFRPSSYQLEVRKREAKLKPSYSYPGLPCVYNMHKINFGLSEAGCSFLRD